MKKLLTGICIAFFLMIISCSSNETPSLIKCARKLRSGMKSDEVKILFPSSYFVGEERTEEHYSIIMTCRYSWSTVYKSLTWLELSKGFLSVTVYFDDKDKITGYFFESSSEPWLFKKEDCTGVYQGPDQNDESNRINKLNRERIRLTGLGIQESEGIIISETEFSDTHENKTVTTVYTDRDAGKETRIAAHPDSSLKKTVTVNCRLAFSAGRSGRLTVYEYDAFGRTDKVTDFGHRHDRHRLGW